MSKRNGRGPSAVIAERLARCRRQMKACGAGAFLLSNHVDYFYVTGFTGEESAVVITPREVHLITDTRFTEEIKHEVPWARSWLRRGFLNDEIVKACTELKIKKLAVQPGCFTVGASRDHSTCPRQRGYGTRHPSKDCPRHVAGQDTLPAIGDDGEEVGGARLSPADIGRHGGKLTRPVHEWQMVKAGASTCPTLLVRGLAPAALTRRRTPETRH